MRIWNLSSFDEVVPTVLQSVDKDSSAEVYSSRKRATKSVKKVRLGIVSTVAFVAIGLSSLTLQISGSDNELRISTVASSSNIQDEKPPLALLFGMNHHQKWNQAKETEMLTKAADVLSISDRSQNAANFIHSVLREDLPHDRNDADELASLGVKLG